MKKLFISLAIIMLSFKFIFAQLVITTSANDTICLGSSSILTVTASGGVPPYTYHWNGQTADSSITVSPNGNTTYSVFVTDNNGNTSQTNHITVIVFPPINILVFANKDSICPGEQVLLTHVITGGTGPPYVIYNHDGQVVSPPIYINPIYSDYYYLSAEDVCGTHDTGFVLINVMPQPPIGVIADTVSGCQPLTVNFTEISPIDGSTFIWDFGDMMNLSLARCPNHTYTDSGIYTVILKKTSIFGCVTICTLADFISVYPKPVASFDYNPSVPNSNDTIEFFNISQGASSYIWAFGNGDSSSITNPILMFPYSGDWSVSLIAISDMGCTDTISNIISVLDDFIFYPNPCNTLLTVNTLQMTTIEIIDTQGQIVGSIDLTENLNYIDLSNIDSGVYTLRIKTDRGIAMRKLIKQ